MPRVTALVDIGQQWAKGETKDVTDSNAVLMENAGWVKPEAKPKPKSKTKTAISATKNKEQ